MKTVWVVLAVISFVASIIMICLGIDKVINYYNPEYAISLSENAYVGGDAYNYIINANYATGYYVLALYSALCGFGCLVVGYLGKIHASISAWKESLHPSVSTPETFYDLPDL